MIQDYKKYAENGRKLADTHSPNYDLSADAWMCLIQDSKEQPDGWYYAMRQEFYVGLSCGYKMAENDRKKSNSFQIRSNLASMPNGSNHTDI